MWGGAFGIIKSESFFEPHPCKASQLHGPPSYFTSDWEQADSSVLRLTELELSTVPGHGKPLAGDSVAEALHQLAVGFGPLGVPENRENAV